MQIKLVLAAFAAAFVATAPAAAVDFSFTGSLPTPNTVQFFDFNVGAESTVTLRTWSYAGGVNAAGATITRGGFDPILALFALPGGALINQNDDGGLNVDPDAVTGLRFDTYLSSVLAPGDYRVSVMAFSNFAIGPNLSDGFENDGSFSNRTNEWAFDILNVNSAVVNPVPEPATWAMLIVGFGAVGFAARRRKALAA